MEVVQMRRCCRPLDMACNSESSFSSEAADVLMDVDRPFLDYINQILMDEGMEDAPYLQQVDSAPDYQAILSSLQEIIADSATTPEDTTASCKGKVAAVEGHEGQHLEEGNGTFKLPLAAADKRFSSKTAELDLSFEDLKLDDVYTSLYVEEQSSSTSIAARNRRHSTQNFLAAGKGRFCKKYTSEVQGFVDVREVLMSCAQAVAIGDARRADTILRQLHQMYEASAHGSALQRIAYIFSKALAARMRGTGVQEFEAMSVMMPSSTEVLRASKSEFEVIPYRKLVHYIANQSILKAAEGASSLHIVDYGLNYGLQWPCLINALADRKGGPPLLVITGIDFPLPGRDMTQRLAKSGRRLAAYAKTYNVPFRYHAIVTDKWEDLDAASLLHSEAEVLVVNCVLRLRHVADDTTDFTSTISPRQKLLTRWHSLNPHLLVTAVVSAAHNSPFFVSRFREALNYYCNLFDMTDTLWDDIPGRLIMERSVYYRNIMNIVACEGAVRVERRETYKQWHTRIIETGFEPLPIQSTMLATSKSHVKKHYHKDFLIHEDKGWMLIGWKGRTMLAISAWKPCHVD